MARKILRDDEQIRCRQTPLPPSALAPPLRAMTAPSTGARIVVFRGQPGAGLQCHFALAYVGLCRCNLSCVRMLCSANATCSVAVRNVVSALSSSEVLMNPLPTRSLLALQITIGIDQCDLRLAARYAGRPHCSAAPALCAAGGIETGASPG